MGLDFEFVRECMQINKIRLKFHFWTKKEPFVSRFIGGSVNNTGAFSCDEVFVMHNCFVFNAMAAKLCKEQQISFGNSSYY